MFNKFNFLVSKAVAKDKSRPILQCINFTDKYTEACNGYIALRVTNQASEETPDGLVDNFMGSMRIFWDSLKDLKFFKVKFIPSLSEKVYVNKDNKIKFQVRDFDKTVIHEVRETDGDFPNLDKIIPKISKDRVIRVDPTLLKNMCEAFEKFSPATGMGSGMYLYFPKVHTKPLVVKGKNKDTEQEMTGIIMGMRIDDNELDSKK